jgi:hypothetical protein
MHLFMVAPLLGAALLGLVSRRLTRVLPPSASVPLLTATALLEALAGGAILGILAFTFAATNSELATLGHWSVPVLRRVDPVPSPLGISAAAVVAVLLGAAIWRACRATRGLWQADAACRRLRAHNVDGLVIVPDAEPDAYALPGRAGQVVVSTAMLRALSAPERRVLLAHESSHLRHRHHLYVAVADIAAAANPMLRPAARAVRAGVERWADEDAAAHVRDRRLAAQALARAALARAHAKPRGRIASATLSAAGALIGDRAKALLSDPPMPRRALTLLVLTLAVLTALSTVATARMTEHRFELAQAAWSQTLAQERAPAS